MPPHACAGQIGRGHRFAAYPRCSVDFRESVRTGRMWVAAGGGVTFKVEVEREDDGRWIAEVPELPGVLAYGATQDEAQAKVQALALRVVAERLDHGEAGPQLLDISFRAA